MGSIICDEELNSLLSGSTRRIRTFLNMMELVAKYYEMPVPEAPFGSDWFHLESQAFCALVEKVFEHPHEFFYAWAQYAAGIYDMIKGEKHQWFWTADELPYMPVRVEQWAKFEIVVPKDAPYSAPVILRARYVGVDIPEKQSNKSFGAK